MSLTNIGIISSLPETNLKCLSAGILITYGCSTNVDAVNDTTISILPYEKRFLLTYNLAK